MSTTTTGTSSAPWITNNTNKSNSNNTNSVNNALGKDDFLKLLVTELKYQDPTSPMDNKEFISQMSTFSSLEQMQNLNTTMTNMAGTINGTLLPSLLLQQSSNMIGKEVSYTSTTTTDGTSTTKTLSGVVESVKMKDGSLYYVIDGNDVAASSITSMAEGSFSTNDQILLEILNVLDDLKAALGGDTGSESSTETDESTDSGTEGTEVV